MEELLLREQSLPPTKELLKNVLGPSFDVFNNLMDRVISPGIDLIPVWNYYKDGKAWLCKVCYKKKTIFWLSVWDGFFKIAFYFTEKNCTGISQLDIKKSIKDDFFRSEKIGKLMPLVLFIHERDQLDDVLKIIEYKKMQ